MNTKETLATVWDQHVGAEFAAKSADQALATMTAEPYVNEIPLMIGGRGRDGVRNFYANHFVSQIPPDIEIVPVSRTIGQGRVVDELIATLHSLDPHGLASARHPADRKARGAPVRRHHAVRRRQDRARAPVLGPGFCARPGRPPRSNASRPRRRNRGASAEPHSTDERAHPSRVEHEPVIQEIDRRGYIKGSGVRPLWR